MMGRKFANYLLECITLFNIGGFTYYLIEIAWRGYSHPTMFVLGGLCFLVIGAVNERLSWDTLFWKQILIGVGFVTLAEFVTGVLLNIILKLDIWDYSDMPLNILGQVCLPFILAWVPIVIAAIILDDVIRHVLFLEEPPRYKFK